jgi:transketolase
MDKEFLKHLRRRIFETAVSGGAGHIASAFSIVEILAALYFENVLKYDASNPSWSERDRFVLSKGHGTLALYVVLCEAGFFSRDVLDSYLKRGSVLGGEADPLRVPGVEALTGSLGHGLPDAAGMALAFKIRNEDNHVFVLVGDGEAEEGSIWEAAMFIAAQGLSNVTVIFDQNRVQKMGDTESIMGFSDWSSKWEAFGFDTVNVDGHDVDALVGVLKTARSSKKPTAVIANTVKGKGVSIMENRTDWHYRLPKKKEMKFFVDELGLTENE